LKFRIRAQPAGGLHPGTTTMCETKAQSSALIPPRCPSCAQPMRLTRRTARFEGLPEVVTFECRACGVSHIEAL
jgi:hypothetical protein